MLVGAFCAVVGARGGVCRPDLGGSGASEHRWKGAWAPIAGDQNPRPCMLGLGLRVNLMEEGVAGHCFIARGARIGKNLLRPAGTIMAEKTELDSRGCVPRHTQGCSGGGRRSDNQAPLISVRAHFNEEVQLGPHDSNRRKRRWLKVWRAG
jgi:hypothetical protein